MQRCPKCGNKVYSQTIVKYKDNGGFKVIGKEVYCPKMDCSYQEVVK